MEESDALPYRFKSAIQQRDDERSGKNLFTRLVGLIGIGVGGHRGGSSFPQPIPVPIATHVTPSGAATARGAVSSGWLAGLNSRVGSLFVLNGFKSPKEHEKDNRGKNAFGNRERKVNSASKKDFFENPIIKNNYEYFKEGVYKLKHRAQGLGKAEYLKWDHLHNDVEACSAREVHLGSIDPLTKKFYKGAQGHKIWSK